MVNVSPAIMEHVFQTIHDVICNFFEKNISTIKIVGQIY